MKKSLLPVLAAAALAIGCNKQDSISFSGVESGVVRSGVFTTDNGTEMAIDGNEGGYDIQTGRRVMVSYEAHPAATSSEVVIDLRQLWDACIAEPVPADDASEEPVDTPVRISQAWFNGGYLNLYVDYFGTDPHLHAFSASYRVRGDGITVRLYHDGAAEADTRESMQDAFICIPMAGAVQTLDLQRSALGQDLSAAIPVLLQWTWYQEEDGKLSEQASLFEKEGSFNGLS